MKTKLKTYSDLYDAIKYVMTNASKRQKRTVFTRQDGEAVLEEFNQKFHKDYEFSQIEKELETTLGDKYFTKEVYDETTLYKIKARSEALGIILGSMITTEKYLSFKEKIKNVDKEVLNVKNLVYLAKAIRRTDRGYYTPLTIKRDNLANIKFILGSKFKIKLDIVVKYLSNGQEVIKVKYGRAENKTSIYQLIHWVGGSSSDILELLLTDELSNLGRSGSMRFSTILERLTNSQSTNMKQLISIIVNEKQPPKSDEYSFELMEDGDYRLTFEAVDETMYYKKAKRSREGLDSILFQLDNISAEKLQSDLGLYVEVDESGLFRAFLESGDTDGRETQIKKLFKLFVFYINRDAKSNFLNIPRDILSQFTQKMNRLEQEYF